MSEQELWAELEKFGCNIPNLKALNLSYTELHDLVNGLRKITERFNIDVN